MTTKKEIKKELFILINDKIYELMRLRKELKKDYYTENELKAILDDWEQH